MSKYAPKPTPTYKSKLLEKKLYKAPWERSQQKLNEIELTDDFFKNIHGCFRWSKIRAAYKNSFIDISRVVDLYKKWRDQNEYLWLEAINTNTEEVITNLFFKCSKRGNDVYKHRLKEKFDFLEKLDPITFFLDTDKVKYSPMLFISPTIDQKKYSLNHSWHIISYEFHLFITKLRQAYGDCVYIRVWESHESGYPHLHLVVYFNKKWFKAIKHIRKKDKKLTYIIPTVHKKRIEKMWRLGNMDIQAVQDTHGAFSEVKKYITKNIWSDKGIKTNALVCLFNKQVYSISRCDPYKKRMIYFKKHNITDWRVQERIFMSKLKKWAKKDFVGAIWGSQLYFDFYRQRGNLAEPGTATLVRDFMHNCNIENIKFRYIGCVNANDLKEFAPNAGDDWLLCADPPPEFKYLIGFDSDLLELDRC